VVNAAVAYREQSNLSREICGTVSGSGCNSPGRLGGEWVTHSPYADFASANFAWCSYWEWACWARWFQQG